MRINTALDSLSQGVLICDRNARILYFNEAYGEYIGQKLAECKGHAITEFRASAQVPDVIRSEEPIEGIIRQERNQQYFDDGGLAQAENQAYEPDACRAGAAVRAGGNQGRNRALRGRRGRQAGGGKGTGHFTRDPL